MAQKVTLLGAILYTRLLVVGQNDQFTKTGSGHKHRKKRGGEKTFPVGLLAFNVTGAGNAFLGAVFTQKRSIYQDRLGTDIDIGKR